MKRRTKIGIAALVGLLVVIGWSPARRHYDAAMLLRGFEGGAHVAIRGQEVRLGSVRARRYAAGPGAPVVLLLPGVHSGGIDEPRFVRFAQLLAGAGLSVTTPDLVSLREVRFDPREIDVIHAAARALARREGRAKVGVIGISFGGGLALIAAARPDTAIGAVLAIGAPHDARRLTRWWLGEPIEGPDGARAAIEPERYGAAVLAYAYADEYFAGIDDRDAARDALRAILESRRVDRELSAAARARLDPLRERGPLDVERLRAIADRHEADIAAVSPAGRIAGVRAPVFLIHGEGDPLIASSESSWIASELAPEAFGGVALTPVIGHADGNPAAHLGAKIEVVHLMAQALAAFEAL